MTASSGIISIQSAVAYGHVGNSAAVFPLQRLGFEVWPVNTVLFSNHTGYGVWRGQVLPIDQVREVLKGVEERGAFARTQAVVSGYLGSADLGRAVLETVGAVRAVRPDMVYACDPVMGDVGRGFFVAKDIPAMFRDEIVPAADIVTPNQFELGVLAERTVDTLDDALAAAAALRARGPRLVMVTSLRLPDHPDELAILADSAAGSWLATTPCLPVELSGTGDVFTALVLGASLRHDDPAKILGDAVASMYGLVAATAASGSRELELIAAQDQIADPSRRFEVTRLR